MQHTFEFVARITDGRVIHMLYKGKTSRHSKVSTKIVSDITKTYGILPQDISELYLKPLKKT